MKKIDLSLNYDEIKKRIELDKEKHKVGEWAKHTGANSASISNIHGKKTKTNPSLEHIVAVSNFTGKPTEWYPHGRWPAPPPANISLAAEELNPYKNNLGDFLCGCRKRTTDARKDIKEVLESDNDSVADALLSNIKVFKHAVKQDQRITELENKIKYIVGESSKMQSGAS